MAAIMKVVHSTIQDALRASSLKISLQGSVANNGSLRDYLPSPPTIHLASRSTGWIRPGGQFIDCAVLRQIYHTGYEFNHTKTLTTPPGAFIPPITPTLPAFTCPSTSTPPPPPAPSPVTPTPIHPYKALIEFRRPPALVHHRVSNPLNLDDVFEFKILETVIDRHPIDLAWKPTTAVTDVSIGRAWAAVWIHMACVLVFWICAGTERVHLALVDLLPDFLLPSFIESVTVGRAVFEDELASVFQGLVLELWLADLFLPVYEDMLVKTTAVEEFLSIEQPESTRESDEDDIAAVEDLIQVAPVELLEAPVQESATVISIERLESDEEEDMATVEELVQLEFDELECTEDYTSGEGSDSDEDMAAVEDMIEVKTEEPAGIQEAVPTVEESTPIAESTRVVPPATEGVLVTAKPEVLVVEEPSRPSLNKDAPAFIPRFARPAVAEPPTLDKVNQTLDELISRMETGRFSGPRDTPPPALVQPDAAPVATPIPPPTAPPAAPDPRRIRTFYAQRPPRPPRRK